MDDKKEWDTVGDRIKWARGHTNDYTTQAELAKKAGVSQTLVASIERGATLSPRAGNLVKLANALNVRPEWLINGAGLPSNEFREQQEVLDRIINSLQKEVLSVSELKILEKIITLSLWEIEALEKGEEPPAPFESIFSSNFRAKINGRS